MNDQHEQSNAGEGRNELTPPMRRTSGPSSDVLRAREAQARLDEHDRVRWEKSIDVHIAAHRQALDFLEETHQWIADHYDLDLMADTRPAAAWQMAGRCIGIARLICDALALGYTAEVLHLARALHEADGLVWMFPQDEGTELLQTWLADEGDEWATRPDKTNGMRKHSLCV
jgi:hypothetical protein